jgi:hypothetical protein
MVGRTISVRSGVAMLNKVGFRGNHSD